MGKYTLRMANKGETMQKITGHVYAGTTFRGCNSSFVITKEGAVVIDTPMVPSEARDWKAKITEMAPVRYVINGEPTEIQVSDGLKPGFLVPEGAYFLVNDNPFSRYADSLRLGLIQRQWVIGRFLSEMPF